MADLADGESIEMQGSGREPYILRNVGGVYSCTCPAWRNQSVGIEARTCKHLRKLRGDVAETERVGTAAPAANASAAKAPKDGPPLLLAHSWENDMDLAGWWMSEKLDGVRAYWDGTRLISRLGNTLHAPDWFLADLPKTPLDGELWLERKAFQRTISIVRRQDKSDHWKQIRYVVFDAPASRDPFEERMKFLKDALARVRSDCVVHHEQSLCKGLDHLRQELARVEALGGEGLMMRKPGSVYEAGRSTTLLKVKTFHDADAVVVEHVAGKGRHKGRLGALVVRMADGTEFSVGTGFSDKQRELPPPVGSTITYRYQELSTGGVPRFPSFVRVRGDAPAAVAPVPSGGRKGATRIAPAPPPDARTSSAVSPPVKPRRFEFVEGNASKFWEIALDGCDVTVRFGRLGAGGQTKTTTFADAGKAQAQSDKLIDEKMRKGYKESAG